MITADDRARGYLVLGARLLGSRRRRAWEVFCAKTGLPVITVRSATYWQVDLDAASLPTRRFDDDDRTWFHERAAVALHESPSSQPRIVLGGSRLRALGMTEREAIALAEATVRHFLSPRRLARTNASRPQRAVLVDLTAYRIRRRSLTDLQRRMAGTADWNGGNAS